MTNLVVPHYLDIPLPGTEATLCRLISEAFEFINKLAELRDRPSDSIFGVLVRLRKRVDGYLVRVLPSQLSADLSVACLDLLHAVLEELLFDLDQPLNKGRRHLLVDLMEEFGSRLIHLGIASTE